LVFGFRGRFAFPLVEFVLVATGAGRFALGAAFAFRFRFRFVEFAFPFALSLPFLFAGFFLGVGVGEADELGIEFSGFVSGEGLAFAVGAVASPFALGRLISTATVWPTFTITPACGS
jgi:hypothetical protein